MVDFIDACFLGEEEKKQMCCKVYIYLKKCGIMETEGVIRMTYRSGEEGPGSSHVL